jgi:hypothetical protein
MVPAQGFGLARFAPAEAEMVARQASQCRGLDIREDDDDDALNQDDSSDSDFSDTYEDIRGELLGDGNSQEEYYVIAN